MNDKIIIDWQVIENKWLALPKAIRDEELIEVEKIDDRNKMTALKLRKEYGNKGKTNAEFLAIYMRYIYLKKDF